MALLGLVTATVAETASAQNTGLPVGVIGQTPRSVSEGVLDLLAYSVVPDGTVSTLQLDRGGEDDNDIGVTLSQLGAGFTRSDSFPLYLEGYLGYARYDPRSSATGRSKGASEHDGTSSPRRSESATISSLPRISICAPS
jgi:hypothetical protein